MNWFTRLIGLLAFLVVLSSPRAAYACPHRDNRAHPFVTDDPGEVHRPSPRPHREVGATEPYAGELDDDLSPSGLGFRPVLHHDDLADAGEDRCLHFFTLRSGAQACAPGSPRSGRAPHRRECILAPP